MPGGCGVDNRKRYQETTDTYDSALRLWITSPQIGGLSLCGYSAFGVFGFLPRFVFGGFSGGTDAVIRVSSKSG